MNNCIKFTNPNNNNKEGLLLSGQDFLGIGGTWTHDLSIFKVLATALVGNIFIINYLILLFKLFMDL